MLAEPEGEYVEVLATPGCPRCRRVAKDEVVYIEVGKRADVVVLDKNLFEIEGTEIGSSKVQLTIFDGRVVYDAIKDATGGGSH